MNKLAGLLTPTRTCMRGHDGMERMPGVWSLNQVDVQTAPDGSRSAIETGSRYVASLWRCNTCGTLELVDEG